MPDLTQLPGQSPKVYGAPLGPQTPTQATDRNVAKPATDEQVKLAYQAYMRQVIQAAHGHFGSHLEAQKAKAANPTPAAPAAPTHAPLTFKGSIPRVEKALADAE